MVQSLSPHSPSDVVAEAPESNPGDVTQVFAAARAAQREWAGGPAAARAQALTSAADKVQAASDEFTDLIIREVGKPRAEAAGEVNRAVAILRYYAQQVFDPIGSVHEPSLSGLLYTQRRPHGVAGLITPWNFPIAIPLWKAAPALAFGNAVVIKPAPEALGVAQRLQQILSDVLPDGLFALVAGDADVGRSVVEQADVVSFTGSTAAGRQIAAAAGARGIPAQAEMGGQNPAIVLPDAGSSAATQIASAAMGYAGQKCTATKRIIVAGDATPVRDSLIRAIEAMPAGDPDDAATVVGPVISQEARDRVVDSARDAVSRGARLLTGGEAVDRDGWFVTPALLENVPADHALACDEVFGPIAVLQEASDLAEATELANNVEHGLVSGIYTSDMAAALTAAESLEAGLVKVNAPTSGVDFYLPFGGEKASSFGSREQGKAAQEFFTQSRTITFAPEQ